MDSNNCSGLKLIYKFLDEFNTNNRSYWVVTLEIPMFDFNSHYNYFVIISLQFIPDITLTNSENENLKVKANPFPNLVNNSFVVNKNEITDVIIKYLSMNDEELSSQHIGNTSLQYYRYILLSFLIIYNLDNENLIIENIDINHNSNGKLYYDITYFPNLIEDGVIIAKNEFTDVIIKYLQMNTEELQIERRNTNIELYIQFSIAILNKLWD
jgi:hypothetical protein